MAPVVKVREFLAAKGGGKASAPDVKVSTPLMRLKLQSRTTTPTAKTGGTNERIEYGSASNAAAAKGTTTSAVEDRHTGVPQQTGQDAAGTELKLTLIQVPMLPKPDVTRPNALTNPKALLQRLNDLRAAGDDLLAEAGVECARGPGPSLSSSGASTSAASLSAGLTATKSHHPTKPHWSLQPASTAMPPPSYCLTLRSPVRAPHPPATSGIAAAMLSSGFARLSDAAADQQQPQLPWPRSPYTTPASPYFRTLGFRAASSFGAATPPPCPPSPPSMLGLRELEHKDTGGGFLTHFADPRDLHALAAAAPMTRGGSGATVGAGAAAGGSATPLSVLRSIHRLQQLKRLQREGSQLVAAMEASKGHHEER